MSDPARTVGRMTEETRARVVLLNEERVMLRSRLEQVEDLALQAESFLEVAARRSGTGVSAWTEAQLDRIVEGARALRRAVSSASLDGD